MIIQFYAESFDRVKTWSLYFNEIFDSGKKFWVSGYLVY